MKNRIETLEEKPLENKESKPLTKWAIFHPLKNKLVFITNDELKQLIDIDRVLITGKHMVIEIEENLRKVWIDAIIVLTPEEEAITKQLSKEDKPLDDTNMQGSV